jgi:hypothetical protein
VIGSDNVKKTDAGKFAMAGTGHAHSRHCMPGSHHAGEQRGGKIINYCGIRVWCCPACVAARAEKARA